MADENRPTPVDLAPDHDQPAPGRQAEMQVQPDSDLSIYKPADKLRGKVALITGEGLRHRARGRHCLCHGGR